MTYQSEIQNFMIKNEINLQMGIGIVKEKLLIDYCMQLAHKLDLQMFEDLIKKSEWIHPKLRNKVWEETKEELA